MNENVVNKEEKLKELEEISKPVIKYLCNNYCPHTTIIITPTSVEVLESIQSVPNINEFIVD